MASASLSTGSTSSSLLRRIQASEPVAWRRFTELYGPLVYHWVRAAGLQPADTADVVQEVFRAVASAIGRFEPQAGGRFRGWLRTITQNKIRDHFRRLRNEPAAQGGTDAEARWHNLADLPEDDGPQTGTQYLVNQALEQLESEFEPKTWQAFWRTTVEHQQPAAVADDLGLSVASVYQAKSRVLRRLRDELAGLI